MYYKNGRRVKVGDLVFGQDAMGNVYSGVVIREIVGVRVSNIVVQPITSPHRLTSADCIHADDLLAVEKSNPAQAVKKPAKVNDLVDSDDC
jgi:hypothetical protein